MPRPLPHVDGVEHRHVDAGGLRMHVAEAGAGEPVVLLHGWPQHWWMWRHLIPPLAERHRVICPDLRGFGWSAAPPSGYDKETLAADVLRLLDALGVRRFRLVGHDWGGVAGFLICLRAPGRVERYLALNTAHPFAPPRPSALPTLWRFWYQAALAAPGIGSAVARGATARRLARRSAPWSDEEAAVFLDQLQEPARARATVLVYRTSLLRDVPRMVSGRYRSLRLRTPTLFLHGTRDPVIRPEILRGFEPYADDMTLELVDGVGHFIAEEVPDLVRERALAFLAG